MKLTDATAVLCSYFTVSVIVLKDDTDELWLLVKPEDLKTINLEMRKHGAKELKKKELYLYGMNRFMYFSMNARNITICCQLACKSTLNGEWVPLDLIINANVWKNSKLLMDNVYYLSEEDLVCWILADCIYTRREFTAIDKERIMSAYSQLDMRVFENKLSKVFFLYTKKLIENINHNEFDGIIKGLWSFSDY